MANQPNRTDSLSDYSMSDHATVDRIILLLKDASLVLLNKIVNFLDIICRCFDTYTFDGVLCTIIIILLLENLALFFCYFSLLYRL